MSGILVAPTEPAALKAIGTVSLATERLGVDVLFTAAGWGAVGVQRKEVRDLVSSVADGRLAREVAQMQRLGLAVLMVEGRPRWTGDGQLVDPYTRWTLTQHKNLLRSVQAKGIWVEVTDSVQDTVAAVLSLKAWVEKGRHNSLDRRPKPGNPWGVATARDFALHLLQSFDGIGPEVANAILDHFGGVVPMRWTVGEGELREVEGIGPKRAAVLVAALEDPVEQRAREVAVAVKASARKKTVTRSARSSTTKERMAR